MNFTRSMPANPLDLLRLKENGFVNANSLKISKTDISRLRYLSRSQYDLQKKNHLNANQISDSKCSASYPIFLNRLPEYHAEIVQILNQFFENSLTQSFLEPIVGNNYKIWQIAYRRSEPGDRGLYLHQDAIGETNICILLSDNHSVNGATAFVPYSHHLPRLLQKLKLNTPAQLVTYLSPLFLQPLNGFAGDIGLFFNKTWHARHHNCSNQIYDVILISLFPEGCTFGPIQEDDVWSPKFLEGIAGTFLESRLNLKINTLSGSGNMLYVQKPQHVESPLSMELEQKMLVSLKPLNIKILCLIFILLATSMTRFIANVPKSIRAYASSFFR